MRIDVLLGLQWGDEGKGKIVDYLSPRYDIIARFQGGPNAGHTLVLDGVKHVLHTVPSGIFRDGIINLIGNGVVVDPTILVRELTQLDEAGVDYQDRLLVSEKAHLILPSHRYLDAASEASKGKEKIGSTLRGIGPTYMDKTGRNGLRVGDIARADFRERYEALKAKHLDLVKVYPAFDFELEREEEAWFAAVERVRTLPRVDCAYYLSEAIKAGKSVLAEGAQGSMLDIDFGTYPYVTSSNTTTSGVCTGLGVPPTAIGEVIGITKAYCTRVGSGPFPTELHDATGEKLRKEGHEFGATTGRPRRCGWIDLPQLRYSVMLNGVTQLTLTKIDILDAFDEIGVCTHYRIGREITKVLPYDLTAVDIVPVVRYFDGWRQRLADATTTEELPAAAKTFIAFIEEEIGVPVTLVSTGPERESLIVAEGAAVTA